MHKLDVYITFPDGSKIACGEIFTTSLKPNGKIEGSFRYLLDYLEHPLAFPLDPVALPLSTKEYLANRADGIHAVFEDALPDAWGRRLLIQQANIPRRFQAALPVLLGVLGPNGLGALSFVREGPIVERRKILCWNIRTFFSFGNSYAL